MGGEPLGRRLKPFSVSVYIMSNEYTNRDFVCLCFEGMGFHSNKKLEDNLWPILQRNRNQLFIVVVC